MTVKAYALIGPDNKAINFIQWDGVTVFDHGQADGNQLVSMDGIERYGFGWEWNGTAFVEPEAPIVVPEAITPRQCRLILMSQGLLAQVEDMIAQQDEATKITWEYALEFRRNDPLLNQLAVNLNLTNEQIDQFFIAAAQL